MHNKSDDFIVRSSAKFSHSLNVLKYSKKDKNRPFLHTPAPDDPFILPPS
jgi:hypothetical protein